MGIWLPTTEGDIDAEWLSAALHDSSDAATANRISQIRIRPVTSAVNLMGEVSRIFIDWDESGARLPATVIAKLPSRNPENRALGLGMGWYEAEHRFYRDLAAHVGLRIPACLFTAADPDTGRYVVLLEDLASLTRVDQLDGLDLARTERTIDALAAMHARWWNNPQLPLVDWLPVGLGEPLRVFGQLMELAWPQFVDATADVLTDADRYVAERFVAGFDAIVDFTLDADWTLIHRDFRVDNMFFDGLDPVVFDWSTVGRGGAFYDVAYFLAGGLEIADRRLHWDRLLSRYVARLDEAGAVVADDGGLALRANALSCLVVPILTGGKVVDTLDARGWTFAATMMRRTFALLHDLDAIAILDA